MSSPVHTTELLRITSQRYVRECTYRSFTHAKPHVNIVVKVASSFHLLRITCAEDTHPGDGCLIPLAPVSLISGTWYDTVDSLWYAAKRIIYYGYIPTVIYLGALSSVFTQTYTLSRSLFLSLSLSRSLSTLPLSVLPKLRSCRSSQCFCDILIAT